MKKIKILFLILILIYPFNLKAENQVYFINLKKVLNESKAGSAAQEKLVKEFENQDKKFKNESNALKKQETELINQKKYFNLSSIYLEFSAKNRKAKSFYENCGFKYISLRKKYYTLNNNKKEDALLYKLEKRT